MIDTLRPETPHQLQEAIAWAVAAEKRLDVVGSGSKSALGRPTLAEARLDLSGLRGIEFYQPEELVIRAHAGTPLAEIDAALADKGQRLNFEPIDYGGLLGGNSSGTLGGLVACNLAGPRRVQTGAARDHVLGFEAISGRAEAFKSGGRVMKNVTGFDLSKLMCGSYGTLAVLHSVTLKVMPVTEKTRTTLVYGLAPDAAAELMCRALGSPHEVSAAAHLPQEAALKSSVATLRAAARSVTALRVEGPGPSAIHRAEQLAALAGPQASTDILPSADSAALWRDVRDVRVFQNDPRHLWRLSVPPRLGGALGQALAEETGGNALWDWGGGLIWLATPDLSIKEASDLRARIGDTGGHATLIRAPENMRRSIPVFHPQPAPLAALRRRIKSAFDPKGVLNPGRIHAEV